MLCKIYRCYLYSLSLGEVCQSAQEWRILTCNVTFYIIMHLPVSHTPPALNAIRPPGWDPMTMCLQEEADLTQKH
ncbi:hypothetical protein GDO81_022734 [Engystomops pustulosus]|uniref:Uncharacterized protein n=1 Tax=Engystomops pustulosus TaxID=76066 RepID=A0AAV6ZVM5_ENGPU|nr:hypothetical protein GDO81_022734 [Engystomops pustulosus]